MTELTSEEFQKRLEAERKETQYENLETIVTNLIGALENDEPPTNYGAIALARAYEIQDRLEGQSN